MLLFWTSYPITSNRFSSLNNPATAGMGQTFSKTGSAKNPIRSCWSEVIAILYMYCIRFIIIIIYFAENANLLLHITSLNFKYDNENTLLVMSRTVFFYQDCRSKVHRQWGFGETSHKKAKSNPKYDDSYIKFGFMVTRDAIALNPFVCVVWGEVS